MEINQKEDTAIGTSTEASAGEGFTRGSFMVQQSIATPLGESHLNTSGSVVEYPNVGPVSSKLSTSSISDSTSSELHGTTYSTSSDSDSTSSDSEELSGSTDYPDEVDNDIIQSYYSYHLSDGYGRVYDFSDSEESSEDGVWFPMLPIYFFGLVCSKVWNVLSSPYYLGKKYFGMYNTYTKLNHNALEKVIQDLDVHNQLSRLGMVSRNTSQYYDIPYYVSGKTYRMILPRKVSPPKKCTIRMYNELAKDVTSQILPYGGPCVDFRNCMLTPEMLGYKYVDVTSRDYFSGETTVVNTFYYDNPIQF